MEYEKNLVIRPLPVPTERMLLAGSMVAWRKYSDKMEAARDVWNTMHRNEPDDVSTSGTTFTLMLETLRLARGAVNDDPAFSDVSDRLDEAIKVAEEAIYV